jgi:hypothetical protein
VKLGAAYGDEIISGIETSSAFILVLSGASNELDFVARELERAISKKKPVIPVRIENVEPSRAPTVYLGHAMGRCIFRKVRDPYGPACRALRGGIARLRDHSTPGEEAPIVALDVGAGAALAAAVVAIAMLLAWPSNRPTQTTDQAPTTDLSVISNAVKIQEPTN